MYACSGCGGQLRFDIATQKMHCDYCDNYYYPSEVKGSGKAVEATEYELTIYTCPQCGGELGASEESTAEFCSFCGAPVILESRLCNIERPKYIIPFQKTKEECSEALKKHLGKSFFVPRKFRNAEIEKIRGIYMPTWNYDVVQNTIATVQIEKKSATYSDIMDVYTVIGKVDAAYTGLSHDASEAFADRISESLEPYTYKNRHHFLPAYVAGFFSDIQDVDSGKYASYAMNIANEQTFDAFISNIDMKDAELVKPKEINKQKMFATRVKSIDTTLIPVWFLSYRKGKRVAYAAVNGETGKVVSDTPVSLPKVLLSILLLAIPLFFGLNMVVSMRARTLVLLAMILMALTDVLYLWQLDKVWKRESAAFFASADKNHNEKSYTKKKWKIKITAGSIALCGIAAIILFALLTTIKELVLPALAAIAGVVIPIYGLYQYTVKNMHALSMGFAPMLLMSLLGAYVYYKNPVSDIYFYAAAIGALGAILIALLNICASFNLLTTRPLPQLKKRGGEEHA